MVGRLFGYNQGDEMKKRHLKRSDFLYIDLERRCSELKEYFADQDCDYFIVHELLIDYRAPLKTHLKS
jgi:hypothetical protein